MYKSQRSGRVYGEPVEIDGSLYLEILFSHPEDGLRIGAVVKWWEELFPPHWMHKLEGEQLRRAMKGESIDDIRRKP